MQPTSLQAQGLFESGLAKHQSGEATKAKDLYQKALDIDPNHFDSLYLLSAIATQQENLEIAINLLIRACTVKPLHADANFNLAVLFERSGKYKESLEKYNCALASDPNHIESLFNRAGVLTKLEQYDEAMTALNELEVIAPSLTQANTLKELVAKEISKLADLKLFLDLYKKGLEQQKNGEYLISIDTFDKALKIISHSAECHHNKGMAYEKLGQFQKAINCYEDAISFKSDSAETHNNLGNVLRELCYSERSINSFKTAIELKPHYPEAFNNMGWALYEQNKFLEAMECFEQALVLRPNFTAAKFNLSYCNLMLGDYANGWINYENRRPLHAHHTENYNGPYWSGKELVENKTILIYAEQGLGDTIQFCRYIKKLSEKGAKVLFQPQPALLELLKDLDGVDQFIAPGDIFPHYDFHCSVMSLPRAFNTLVNTIPSDIPYLKIDPTKNAFWREKFRDIVGPKIGLVWSGGFRPNQPELWGVNKRRNLSFEQISALNIHGCNFFSLQKGEPAEKELLLNKDKYWATSNLYNHTSELKNFSDTAALINNLDLIISVDTSTAHLAGALGKSVWILNRFNNCWRWLDKGNKSHWYPTVRLFRQNENGNWDNTIIETKKALESLVKNWKPAN